MSMQDPDQAPRMSDIVPQANELSAVCSACEQVNKIKVDNLKIADGPFTASCPHCKVRTIHNAVKPEPAPKAKK